MERGLNSCPFRLTCGHISWEKRRSVECGGSLGTLSGCRRVRRQLFTSGFKAQGPLKCKRKAPEHLLRFVESGAAPLAPLLVLMVKVCGNVMQIVCVLAGDVGTKLFHLTSNWPGHVVQPQHPRQHLDRTSPSQFRSSNR